MKLSEAITKYGDVDIWKCPEAHHGKAEVIIKPEPKKINMSVCIESGIDCEFWSGETAVFKVVGKLHSIVSGAYPFRVSTETKDIWNDCMNCRPRMNHIHASPTGWDKYPIPEGFKVNVWTRYNEDVYENADYIHDVNWRSVTMFEITGIADDYEL